LSLLEHGGEAACALDADFRCVYLNAAAERLLRKGRAALLAKTLWHDFPGEGASGLAESFRRAASTNAPADFRIHWPPLDASLDVRFRPTPGGAAVYFSAVSDQPRGPADNWERLRLITDSLPALISYVDRDLRYQFSNSAYGEWFDVKPEAMLGKTIPELLDKTLFESRRPFIERALRGERLQFDADTPHKSLGVRHTEMTYVPDIRGGEIRGFYVLVHDITDRARTEEAHREGERRLRLALSATRMGIWERDFRTDTLHFSPEAFEVLGMPWREVPPRPDDLWSMVHPGDAQNLRDSLADLLRDGSGFARDLRVIRPDGAVRWARSHGILLRDERGQPARMIGTIQDVTARKDEEDQLRRSEQTLRESRERLRVALAAAELGTWRLDLNTHLAVHDEGMNRLIGLDPVESEVSSDQFISLVHPDDRANFDAALRRALADRGTYLAEFRIVRPDGATRWIREQGKVLCDDGGPRWLAGASVDITDRKRAEQAVREANQRMMAVVDASPLAVMALDLHGTVLLWNPAAERMLGWTADEAIGRFTPAVPDDQAEGVREIIRRSLAGNLAAGLEVRRRRKDGSVFDAALWTARLLDDAGKPIAVLGILADITERKHAEVALEQARAEAVAARAVAEAANQSKDQFLAVLSHELRTPLAPVVMTVAGLELDRSLSQEVRDDLAMIRRNVELETKLIDDLLDVTRIVNGKLRLQHQPTDVHALVGSVTGILGSDLRSKRLHLHTELAALEATVAGDAARLQQVIWNLLKNAIKFTPDGGNVAVRTWNPSPRTFALEVSDDGIGIDPAALPRLFQAFEQAEQSITRQFGGLGLGLAISKALVELHGGAIRADSSGRGRGATFAIELPTVGAVERVINPIQPTAGAAHAAGHDHVRVLLVEDHPDTLRTLKRLLEKMGYRVTPAASASAALNILATEPVDVLVSDIGLPDFTGHELMRKVRAINKRLPGIAVSGFGRDADLKNSHDAGFLTHITKPVDVQQLDAAIRSAVRRAAPAT
jgi:PAS domain S-box-containing protein